MDLSFKEIAGAVDISKCKFNIAVRNRNGFIAEEEFTNDPEYDGLVLKTLYFIAEFCQSVKFTSQELSLSMSNLTS